MITITGTGCCLMDYLYLDVDFHSPGFATYGSKREGDGGLAPGKLVFADDFEGFAGKPFAAALRDIVGDRGSDVANIGGPSVVSLINAAQLLSSSGSAVRFYGARGRDKAGDEISSNLRRTPIDAAGYSEMEGDTPYTYVLSDPRFDGGRGERTFVNNVGTAARFGSDLLPGSFFEADIIAFGGTALVPRIHDGLSGILDRGKRGGAATIVNTVYDFRNEAKKPGGRWPMGDGDDSYRNIDLLITDGEEAFKLSGRASVDSAVGFFGDRGAGAAIVTAGARNIAFYSGGGLFRKTGYSELPVSSEIVRELAGQGRTRGDTTGCGDNFVGGVLASMAMQLAAGEKPGNLDLRDACAWGIASGGFCCFYPGGVFYEESRGEKFESVERYYRSYTMNSFA
jgi:sugar/nucleoside kinase (ribokinase family)